MVFCTHCMCEHCKPCTPDGKKNFLKTRNSVSLKWLFSFPTENPQCMDRMQLRSFQPPRIFQAGAVSIHEPPASESPGACQECRSLGLTPDLQSETLWGQYLGIYILISVPDNSPEVWTPVTSYLLEQQDKHREGQQGWVQMMEW